MSVRSGADGTGSDAERPSDGAPGEAVSSPATDPPLSRSEVVAEVLAALAYGERCGAERARRNVELAPDPRARTEQDHVARREEQNWELMQARLQELGEADLMERFRPFFDGFFEHTEPADWVEAQTFHYVGDALVSDFAEVLAPLMDRVSAEVVRSALGDRTEQETFALDELTRAMREDPSAAERIREYAQRIVGEGFTQTSRALERTHGMRTLLGGADAGKRLVLLLLDHHRQRIDRLGIEPVEE